MARNGAMIFLHQNTVRGPFHIFKLPAPQRPPEYDGDKKDQDQAERHQQVNDIHGWLVHGRE